MGESIAPGKSVLCSAIIDRFSDMLTVRRAFAFLTYRMTNISALSIILSLVFQLAERDEDDMALVCQSMSDGFNKSLDAAGKLLSSLASYAGPIYLIIDGVDEIRDTERKQLIDQLMKQGVACRNLRLIFSSRPEADLMQLLGKGTVIQIHNHNEKSIRNYVDRRRQNIFHPNRVAKIMRSEIKKLLLPLPGRAKGMFLFARLVMDMVDTMHDLSEIQNELTVLPESLDDAYRRIISRIGQHGGKQNAEKARRLLGWIACSPVAITVEEAQQALVVQSNNRDQVYYAINRLDPLKLLGPIVETADNCIRFVHFTAKEYICSPHLGAEFIDVTRATLDFATRCIDYLCQRHHDPDLTQGEYLEKLCTGQYSFHALSTRMWFELVCQYLELIGSTNPSVELTESVQKLFDIRQRQIEREDCNDDEDHSRSVFEVLRKQHPRLHRGLNEVSRFRDSSYIFTGQANLGTSTIWSPRGIL
ncbi:hypothetical protein F4777DRAFT_404413 [Nemania sp. FL0916]|nr:hypothetical protein F4777DRAFT_404413 [Nemania sp. FL0916]